MVNDEFSMLYKKYYTRDDVLFEILKSTKSREMAMINPDFTIRCMYCSSIKFLKWNVNEFGGFDRNMSNFYYSIASVKNMPVFDFKKSIRQEQQEKFNKEFNNYVIGYDFFIDLDRGSVPEPSKKILKKDFNEKTYIKSYLINDMKKLKKVFDDYKIPYSLRFSGSGFHFLIADKYLPNDKFEDKIKLCKNIAFDLKNWFGIMSIDDSIYNARRICKIPYTIDIKTGNVCMPLTDDDAENFDYNNYHITVLIDKQFRGRGLLSHNEFEGNDNICKLINYMGTKVDYNKINEQEVE